MRSSERKSSCHHFVKNKNYIIFCCNLSQKLQVFNIRCYLTRTAHNWLYNDTRYIFVIFFYNFARSFDVIERYHKHILKCICRNSAALRYYLYLIQGSCFLNVRIYAGFEDIGCAVVTALSLDYLSLARIRSGNSESMHICLCSGIGITNQVDTRESLSKQLGKLDLSFKWGRIRTAERYLSLYSLNRRLMPVPVNQGCVIVLKIQKFIAIGIIHVCTLSSHNEIWERQKEGRRSGVSSRQVFNCFLMKLIRIRSACCVLFLYFFKIFFHFWIHPQASLNTSLLISFYDNL